MLLGGLFDIVLDSGLLFFEGLRDSGTQCGQRTMHVQAGM